MADERDNSKLGWTALGACIGAIAVSPFALIVGLWAAVFAGGSSETGGPTQETTAVGLPYGVLVALALIAVGAAVGAVAGRAFASGPRTPQN